MISTWRRNRRTHTVGVFVAGLTALGLAACSGSPSTTGTGSRQGGPAAPNPNPGVGAPGAPASAGAGAPGADSRGVASPAPTSRPTSTRDFSMTDPAKDRLSTFALDIDTGSYTRFRDATNRGQRVSPNEVRTEEFVNYFEQEYAAPADGLDVRVDAATLPFGDHHTIVRVGVRSADVTDSARPDADLSLVVDCSGSMADGNKMPMTKAALTTLLRSLRPTDKVAIVCYSTTARVLLPPTPASERDGIQRAIDSLRPEQSTNAEAGLDLGYQQARAMATSGRMTRVILVSDGVANVGNTSPEGILAKIGDAAREGISLISVGVGISGYNDRLLEQLADKGNGWHVYVDTQAEADRVFGQNLTGSLVITARQAKAQVDFDPSRVAGYRLLGYENRAVADRDFRNDSVDGGEIFAGHSSTALYEVVLAPGASGVALRATVRYVDAGGATVERSAQLSAAQTTAQLSEAHRRLHQDVLIAMLADRLMTGPWSGQLSAADLQTQANAVAGRLDGDAAVGELLGLIRRSQV